VHVSCGPVYLDGYNLVIRSDHMPDNDNERRSAAELEKLGLEIEKLRRDIASSVKLERYDLAIKLLPSLTVIVTVLGFAFTLLQYRVDQQEKRGAAEEQLTKEFKERAESAQRELATEQRQFMKPLLEKQQSLYFEASSATAIIASSSDQRERTQAANTFWRLYWGPLAMVESTDVSGAMKSFGYCLSKENRCDSDELRHRSLALASALEASMLKTWKANPSDFTNEQFTYR
jgi:hypothetical protein